MGLLWFLLNTNSRFKQYETIPMKINKRNVVITGGTSGIGYEIAKYLHLDNKVIVIARDASKLNALAQECQGITTYQADLSKADEVKTVADHIVKDVQSIDILINNAAVQCTATFMEDHFNYEDISHEIAVNFTSVCSLTYLLLPTLLQPQKAIILNINSGLALAPKTTSAIYCATKGALNIFSQSLRYQLEKTNISVQQAFLQLVDTSMTSGRGNNKMSAEMAAKIIIDGMERGIADHDIGKVKWLRMLLRWVPSIGRKIMKQY